MKAPKILNYITPQIVKYQNIDDLLENNRQRTFFDVAENLSIDKLLEEYFVCVVGEPGIGKSRLVDEIKKQISANIYPCSASKFNPTDVPAEKKYCIVDALDEVEGNSFYDILQSIKQYKEENLDAKILFTCRKHYVASYAKYFSDCRNLRFVEIRRLNENEVMNVVNSHCCLTTIENINKSPKLRELITIPRYLTFLLECDEQKGGSLNIGELFEYMIARSIQAAIKFRKGIKYNENNRILVQRTLEKVAFVMEISRRDQISKDELYTILDGIKGNMTQMLTANFDLLFFQSRILKDTNGVLQFENTELQEYLAAKELCRQDNIESMLYDVAVHRELKHIYPNWNDVIPHISYSDDRIQTFINVFKLIVSYESNLDNKSFENLLKYVDSSVLSLQQKEDLFSIIFEHYQRIPAYIMWKGSISQLLQECYTTGCDVQMLLPFEYLNKIQLSNIYVILDAIVENNNLSKCVSAHWIEAANELMATDDDEKWLAALNLYNALKCTDELIKLSKSYCGFTQQLKEKYCEVTGYGKFVETDVVDCWLNDCYTGNPYAINAVLCIEDLATIIYAYNKILEDDKLYEFFNKKGALVVCYELYLKKQFDIVWKGDTDSRQLITRIIAGLISNHSHTTHSVINVAVKQILLEEATGSLFIASFERKWDLEDLFRHFDAELIDIELVSSLDKLLPEEKSVIGNKDHILTTLIYKIRNDAGKKASIKDYVKRYSAAFERWDKESSEIENEKVNSQNQQLIEAYQNISDPNISQYDRYEAAFELSNNIEFVRKQDHQPLIDAIKSFFKELDLDQMTVKRNTYNSFTLHLSLPKIPCFAKILYCLNCKDLLNDYRIILAKTLPSICVTRNYDTREIKEIYRSVIGSISDDEKKQLVEWWKSREDDFMDISSDDIFACITDYGIEALSYKLEEYIEQYKANQNLDYSIAASKALDVISDYNYWDINKYRDLFGSLKDDGITSIKMKCNGIMIEKFKDTDAIKWRMEYLKNNVVKSLHNDTGHARPISYEESEMISPNPYMFRCFMNIKDDETLAKQMLELFDFGLSLCENFDTQEYARYLLNQIYLFFVSVNNIGYISILRNKVEAHNAKGVSFLATSIMNNAEMMFLINEKVSIGRAVKQYNKCIEESYLNIRNDGDLRRFFTVIHSEVQKEIQDQGIYTLVRPDALSEDFIQRELKNTIINKCCQMGLEAVRVDREVALQDNKRTDLLIRYGLCNPIMVELKLLHNKEIQEKKKRQEYRKKFVQYTNATGACLSVFWVFDVHRENSKRPEFEELKLEYKDLPHTSVLLTDCKCSSGIETGLSKKQTNLKDSKAFRNKKVKGKKGTYQQEKAYWQ